MNPSPLALKRLRRQWAYAAAAGGGCIAGVAGLLAIRFSPNVGVRWAAPALIVLTWFFFRMQRALARNHAPGDSELRPSLGAANAITITRAALAATLAGFIIQPPPTWAEAIGSLGKEVAQANSSSAMGGSRSAVRTLACTP